MVRPSVTVRKVSARLGRTNRPLSRRQPIILTQRENKLADQLSGPCSTLWLVRHVEKTAIVAPLANSTVKTEPAEFYNEWKSLVLTNNIIAVD